MRRRVAVEEVTTTEGLEAISEEWVRPLAANGRLVAALYGLIDARGPRRRAYYYIGGFDPEVSGISPGTLLIGHALQEAAREGCQAFDFLRGNEAYKRLWGAVEQPTYRRLLGGPGAC